MVSRIFLAIAIASFGLAPASASAQVRSDQDTVFENRQQGRTLSLREIQRRVERQMGNAQHMGNPQYFERSNTYRMTFMRGNEVIRVEVDARTGRIRSRSDR